MRVYPVLPGAGVHCRNRPSHLRIKKKEKMKNIKTEFFQERGFIVEINRPTSNLPVVILGRVLFYFIFLKKIKQ